MPHATMQIVTLSAAELESLVTTAVSRALQDHERAPALLDRQALAKALSCSPSHVDSLRRRGMPTILMGDAPRFRLEVVLEWLQGQGT